MSNPIDRILSELQIHPVLVDIGASGATPKIWAEIARHSIYVGFDPDLREVHQTTKGYFFKALIVNEAVTNDRAQRQARFYLTKSPYCSSTLQPAVIPLSDFLFSELFSVERETLVQATTLDQVLETWFLPGVDWFKTDSQGIDLRLFASLGDQCRSRVMAVDVEPGLIDAYIDEDKFEDVHHELTQSGFWLSNLGVQGALRMRRSTMEKLRRAGTPINESQIEMAVKKTPAWCEARYLRTIEWLVQNDFGRREYALLWIFACLDGQHGFCLDLVVEYEKLFGQDNLVRAMRAESLARIRTWRYLATAKNIAREVGKGIRRLARFSGCR